MSKERKTAFISSTSIDLPEHREAVKAVCLELGLFPDGMEHWPAVNADAVTLCLGKVAQAQVFVGVYAHRYGWTPPGQTCGITELEYDHAKSLNLPRLLFLVDEKHPWPPLMVDKGADAQALANFKQRIQTELVRALFTTPDSLRAQVMSALRPYAVPVHGATPGNSPVTGPHVYLGHLPAGAAHFQARQAELTAMDAAWQPGSGIGILSLIAPGGVGKTSLLKRWLDQQKERGWPGGVQRVFGWSFYSQGASADRQTSDEPFLNAALKWFGVPHAENTQAWEKGELLANALRRERCLLVLDGLEPLQYPPNQHHSSAQLAGRLRAPGVQALLETLATSGHGGLVLISSREAVEDLAEYRRDPECHPNGCLLQLNVGNLNEADGARLLFASGATRAGAEPPLPHAQAAADDAEWQAASREVQGHALTLRLLGEYLRLAHGGDVRRRSEVRLSEANAEVLNGHAFRVMQAYETWFAQEGAAGQRCLAALRLLGFFDRPAPAASVEALRSAPPIDGLTEALFLPSEPRPWWAFWRKSSQRSQPIADTEWRSTLTRLADIGLLTHSDYSALDAHPLLRQYLADALQQQQPAAWREGHRRVFEQLCADTPHHPEGVAGLAPLYQAVVHGCAAEMHQTVRTEIYRDRILRGDVFYSVKKHGMFGADLAVMACFFRVPWSQVHPAFSALEQSWLLSQSAVYLRALGRLEEAQEPMRAGAEMRVQQELWENAATTYCNLSELQLTLGDVTSAIEVAKQAISYADAGKQPFKRVTSRAILADALYQQGRLELAERLFQDAQTIQKQDEPTYPLLYSLWGFLFNEHQLASAEQIAWGKWLDIVTSSELSKTGAQQALYVEQRVGRTLKWAELSEIALLDIALDHLTLARCALYQHGLGQPHSSVEPHLPAAHQHAEQAVGSLRAAGSQHHLPRGLLTRACILHSQGEPQAAERDLAEAQRIAQRGGMRLHLADVYLTRARLFRRVDELDKAQALIEACGYGRRRVELAQARAALGTV